MKKKLTIILLLLSTITYGQKSNSGNTKMGEISWGIRSTGSLFSASGNNFGIGAGWQIRFRLSEKLNSEWFSDWITTDINGLGQRNDAHVGVSTMIYPFKNKGYKNTISPYILGGFCADYTKIKSNFYFDNTTNEYTSIVKDRWSFATQLGLGTHYNFTDRFDISFSAQYILHTGKDLHSEIETDNNGNEYLHLHEEAGGGLEGHLFLTLSANYMIADLLKQL